MPEPLRPSVKSGRPRTRTASTARVHVDGLRGMGERFVDAWRCAERGEPVHEAHVTYVAVLESIGLRVRDGRTLSAPWDELQASVMLAPTDVDRRAHGTAPDTAQYASSPRSRSMTSPVTMPPRLGSDAMP